MRVSLKARGKSRLVDMVGAGFLGKGKGRKGEMSTGLMVGYLVGWCGEGYWCGVEGSFGEGVVW